MKFRLSSIKPGEWIGVVGLSIMGSITFANILARYVFKTSWAFTEELVTGLFLLVSLIGAAMGAERGTLMGLSMFTDLLPGKCQKYVSMGQAVFVFIFAVFLCWYGAIMTMDEWRLGITTGAMGIPEAVYGSFVPIGAFFIMVGCLRNLYRAITSKSGADDKPEPGPESY